MTLCVAVGPMHCGQLTNRNCSINWNTAQLKMKGSSSTNDQQMYSELRYAQKDEQTTDLSNSAATSVYAIPRMTPPGMIDDDDSSSF